MRDGGGDAAEDYYARFLTICYHIFPANSSVNDLETSLNSLQRASSEEDVVDVGVNVKTSALKFSEKIF